MTSRRIFIGTLVLGAALAACGREAAGPTVDQSNTGGIQVQVLSDTTVAGTNFTGRAGIAVTVTPKGDNLVLRRSSTGTGGIVVFRGLAPGDYVVKPVVRPFTTYYGPESTIVTVKADTIVTSDAFQFRQGGRITGFLGYNFVTDTGAAIGRLGAGKIVELLKDTSAAKTGKFVVVATDTTDAAGAFELLSPAFPQPYAIRFTSGVTGINDSLVFVSSTNAADTVQKITDAQVTYRDLTTSAGGLPAGSVTRNLLFGIQGSVSGRVWRDYNGDGVYNGTAENLIPGDTVNFQLRTADGTKVVATARATSTAVRVPSYLPTVQGYQFLNVAPGTYKVVLVKATSRFAPTPVFVPRADTVTATVNDYHYDARADFPVRQAP